MNNTIRIAFLISVFAAITLVWAADETAPVGPPTPGTAGEALPATQPTADNGAAGADIKSQLAAALVELKAANAVSLDRLSTVPEYQEAKKRLEAAEAKLDKSPDSERASAATEKLQAASELARVLAKLQASDPRVVKATQLVDRLKKQDELNTEQDKRKPVLDNKWAGFRGLKWGDNIAKVRGMVLSQDSGDTKFYRRDGDKLVIGAAKLDRIQYGFYKGRLCYVLIQAGGDGRDVGKDWDALKDAVFATYGKGCRQPKESEVDCREKWWWGAVLSDVGVKDVSMALVLGRIFESTLVMSYIPITDQAAADKAKKAQEEAAEKAKKAQEAGKDF